MVCLTHAFNDSCECCRGLRGHARLKDVMCEAFEHEFHAAKMECERLQNLFNDVCWYNFETQCRNWQRPWPASWPNSEIELHGVSITMYRRNGRDREVGHFPVYYSGRVHDAPPLPPQVLLTEMKLAADYLEKCRVQCSAPHDWAPGGCKYNELLQTTKVPTELHKKCERAVGAMELISKRIADGDRYGNRRARRKERRAVGRQAEARA